MPVDKPLYQQREKHLRRYVWPKFKPLLFLLIFKSQSAGQKRIREGEFGGRDQEIEVIYRFVGKID